MTLWAAGQTDVGKKRKINQDSILLCKDESLFVVADGMGGHQGGEVASQMAVEIFEKQFRETKLEDPLDMMETSIKEINNEIFAKAQETPDLKGMGTTVVSFFSSQSMAYLANVGDSRCYLIQQDGIFQLTRDHSLIQEKINMGVYTREQAELDPMKNVLVRSVGHDSKVEVDTFFLKIRPHDIFLLCSDGLHGKVTDEKIFEIVRGGPLSTENDLERTVQKLIDEANANGGQDNISAIIISFV